jgi:CDP-diacylglycerol--glycerol-3-phosphate 3-phosphatidyltransferase
MATSSTARAPGAFGPTALATPANAVTIGRVVAMPVLIAMIVDGGPSWPAVAFWFVISCTDGLDGWLARRQGTTRSGAFLDPLADKVVVLAAMVALVAKGSFWWLPVMLIAARELGLIAYRTSASRRGVSIPARSSAKLKTVVQDLAIGIALLPPLEDHAGFAGSLLWCAVVLTVVTGTQYLLDGRRVARAVARAV